MVKIYFAHPVNTYNTPFEEAFLRLIAVALTNGDMSLIENPNQPYHQEGYSRYAQRQKESGLQHRGMGYFYDEVLPRCSEGCVGVPFLDNRFGLGVAGELKWFIDRKLPTWRMIMSEKLFSEFIKNPLGNNGVSIFSMDTIDRNLVQEGDTKLIVSHEETRLRTWKIYNRVLRPYEEAHLVRMPIPENFYPER